jgi:gas vesicle protein
MGKTSKFVKGALFGALTGGVLALLFAPKSGEDLRQELKDKADEFATEVKKAAEEAQNEMEKEVVAPQK